MTEKKRAFKCAYLLVIAVIKQWRYLTLFFIIMLICVSCSNAAQQTPQSQRKEVQSPHAGMPLTDSPPLQRGMTPTVFVSTPSVVSSTSYEAEAADNTKDGTKIFSCNLCSGGLRVSWIGYDIFLQFNNVYVDHNGNYTLRVYYLNSIPNRVTSAFVSIDGGPNIMVPGIQVLTVNCCDNVSPQVTLMTVSLQAGNNAIRISNPTGHAPDIDRIIVG